jgi:hypothetical protein
LHHLVEREAACLLAGRKLLERGEEATDVLLRRHEQEDTIDPPACVTDADMVGLLERIRAKIEELGQAQRDKRFLPYM